jgi:hypothetical protein
MEFQYLTPQLDYPDFLRRLSAQFREQILTHAGDINTRSDLTLNPERVSVTAINEQYITQGILWIAYSIQTNTAQNFTGQMPVEYHA